MLESLSKIALAAGFIGAGAKSFLSYYINGPKCEKWPLWFQVRRDAYVHVMKETSYEPLTDEQIEQLDFKKIAATEKKGNIPGRELPRKLGQVKQSAIKVGEVSIDEELFSGTGPAESGLRQLTAEDRTPEGMQRKIPYEILVPKPMLKLARIDEEKRKALFECAPLDDNRCVILYLHGGGYRYGSPASHRPLVGRIALRTGVRCVSVDYRLATPHPYPAQLHDAYIAFCYLLQQGFSPEDIVIAGDSAGGNLALILALLLRHTGITTIRGLVLLSPWADLVVRRPSVEYNRPYDTLFAHPLTSPLDHARMYYAPGRKLSPEMLADLSHPLVSPISGDFKDFPPTLIQAGDKEVLYDEITQLHKNIRAANDPVHSAKYVYECYPDMIHVFHQVFDLPQTKAAYSSIGKFVRGLPKPML
ncbi:hypothetical protein IW140_001827 [Coemansia sp. RSA 1813]|nr:hypothetical protein EV178_002541 [Coemansia sp. RSA 1646]KAJ1772432.1 hypothetical protein LPJ74_001523 [Coemansia sp. RSA 1843]KAJ2091151.1 hypothetical protein IW138_002114 [Coemansia sp. RSA 986]KAJ2213594.1 hypothetical protein EV179_003709 [Coemansia sp. RSA 487]KAJ2571125.1 hypothetical protein IW140_001827 [Coemansia sp. RSA 1813]